MSIVISIIVSLLGLGLLAAAHELGHFFAARLLGVTVEELSVFVGPSLVHWNRKGVVYHIRLIPFGAYVRFPGLDEDEAGQLPENSYLFEPRWKRLLISLAGPITNLVLGILIFMLVFGIFGFGSTRLSTIDSSTQMSATAASTGDEIVRINDSRVYTYLDLLYFTSEISNTDPMRLTLRSAATGTEYDVTLSPDITKRYQLGVRVEGDKDSNGGWTIISVDEGQNDGNPVLKPGDSILSVNGVSVFDAEYKNVLQNEGDTDVTVSIVRDGTAMDVTMKPMLVDTVNPRGILLQPGSGAFELVKQSSLYSVSIIRVTVMTLRDMVNGKVAPQNVVSGPVGIVTMVNDVVATPQVDNSLKAESLLQMAAFISVGLAFTNLLPLPGLDGNALVIVIVEMIRGKKLSLQSEKVLNIIGFGVLIALTIFALSSDILRLVG